MITREKDYRPDIDGLRAIAVLAVFLFHLNPNHLKGGFVGVDVFFVISGFLITSHIAPSIASNSFALSSFYSKRIVRLYPALLLIIASTAIFGYFCLYSDEFAAFCKSAISAILFIPNLLLLKEAGYFDKSAELKPLLHLWSLGVEEQFYLIWPLFIFLIKGKLRLKNVIYLAALSFFFNIFLVAWNRDAAFYLPIGRFWEMLFGAAIFSLNQSESAMEKLKKWIHVISWAGIFLTILSFLVIRSSRAYFPGAWALIPTAGAFLVILAGKNASANRTILTNRFLVSIGVISYPVYLWHWPLLFGATILTNGNPSNIFKYCLVLMSFPLAYATHRFIEEPIQKSRIRSKACWALVLLFGSVLMGTIFLFGLGGNLRVRDKSYVLGSALSIKTIAGCGVSEKLEKLSDWCLTERDEPINAVVFGDSKAHAVFPGIISNLKFRYGWKLIARHGCPPLLDVEYIGKEMPLADRSDCEVFVSASTAAIANDSSLKIVIISAKRLERGVYKNKASAGNLFDGAYLGLKKTVQILLKANKRVVLLLDNPEITETPELCLKRPNQLDWASGASKCSIPVEKYLSQTEFTRDIFSKIKVDFPSIAVFDPRKILCSEKNCPVVFNGQSYYSYTSHLSDVGNQMVGKGLAGFLSEPAN